MGIFKNTDTTLAEEREQRDALLNEMAELRAEIHGLRKERGDLETRDRLQAEIERLKKEKVSKEIDYDREKEKWDRERREVEHMVGLHRKTADFEHEKAVSEATLKIREDNLAEDRRRFDEQLAFNNARYEKTEGYMKDMVGQILDRLPTVNVDMARDSGAKE